MHYILRNIPGCPCIELHFGINAGGKRGEYLADFELWPENLVEAYLNSEPLSPSTRSEQTMDFLLQKLYTCAEEHPTCLSQGSIGCRTVYRPLRLIDVGFLGEETVRLVQDDSDSSGPVSYATLSHCWGKANVFKLTKDTALQMREGIGLNVLPKTFQDAVYVTRTLGLRFLWIDSLCVIQDSFDDWAEQAPTMQDIYRHAFVNIAASFGGSSTAGLFRQRISESVQPFRVEASWMPDESDPMFDLAKMARGLSQEYGLHFLRPRPCTYICMDAALWRDDVEEAPLNTRAWVMQERLLSPRTFHFGWRQVYWQCRENEACEIFPRSDLKWTAPSTAIWSQWTDSMGTRAALDAIVANSSYIDVLHRRWRDLITAYSVCRLSHEEDIFVAMQGLVNEFSDRTGEKWVAGFWRSQLPGDLCWITQWNHPSLVRRLNRNSLPKARPSKWRAPSWSWAATLLPAFFLTNGTETPLVELLDVRTVQSKSGRYENAALRVRGALHSALVTLEFGIRSEDPGQYITFFKFGLGKKIVRTMIFFDDVVDFPENFPKVHFLPACLSTSTNGNEVLVLGLLLVPTNSARGTFQRYGVFRVSGRLPYESVFASSEPHDWIEYESWNGRSNGYVLSIV